MAMGLSVLLVFKESVVLFQKIKAYKLLDI